MTSVHRVCLNEIGSRLLLTCTENILKARINDLTCKILKLVKN